MAYSDRELTRIRQNWLFHRQVDPEDIPWLLGNIPGEAEWARWDAHLACSSVGVDTAAPAGLVWLGITRQLMHLAYEVDADRIFAVPGTWQILACETMIYEYRVRTDEVIRLDCESGDLDSLQDFDGLHAVREALASQLSEDQRFTYAGYAATAAFGQTPSDSTIIESPLGDIVATCSDDGVIRLYGRKDLEDFAEEFPSQAHQSWPTLELVGAPNMSALQIASGSRISDGVSLTEPGTQHTTWIATRGTLPDVEPQRVHDHGYQGLLRREPAVRYMATRSGGDIRIWSLADDTEIAHWAGPSGCDINSWVAYQNGSHETLLCAHVTAADDDEGEYSWLGWWNVETGDLLRSINLPGYAEIIPTPSVSGPYDLVTCSQDPGMLTQWNGETFEKISEVSTTTPIFATASSTPAPEGLIAVVTASHIEWYSTSGGLHECVEVDPADAEIRQDMAAGPFGQGVAIGVLDDGRLYYAWLSGIRSVIRFAFADNPHDVHSAFLTWIEPVAFNAYGKNLLVRGVHGAALLDVTEWENTSATVEEND